MPDRVSTLRSPVRAAAVALAGLGLAGLATACTINATVSQPPATITFVVRDATNSSATYRFSGSVTLNALTGQAGPCADTTIHAPWDPIWTFEVDGRTAVASTDSADFQPGASARDGLTVVLAIDASGIRATNAHPGPPLPGDLVGPSPCT